MFAALFRQRERLTVLPVAANEGEIAIFRHLIHGLWRVSQHIDDQCSVLGYKQTWQSVLTVRIGWELSRVMTRE